jgi:putative ABC transport system ATP-binding protein
MIELNNVCKMYTMGTIQLTALDDISFHCEKGEIVSIMGPSGSGKSTMMNILGCLDRPTSGSYLLDGQDISSLNDNQLANIRNRKLGFVFQSYNLLPKLSALANVELPLIYRGEDHRRERALAALEAVGISQRAKHKPSEMSGGEQQRVAIARALANNPRLILADEPTASQDTVRGKKVMEMLKKIAKENQSAVIVVTHDVRMIEGFDAVYHLKDGRLNHNS